MSLRTTWSLLSVVLGGLALGAASCHDSTPPPEPATPAPTAYTLPVPAGFPTPLIPADNPLTNEGIALGRMLFYEKALSANGSMSCGCLYELLGPYFP